MTDIGFVVRLNVTLSATRHLELPLDDQVWAFHFACIAFLVVRFLWTKPESKIVTGLRSGYVLRVKSHGADCVP